MSTQKGSRRSGRRSMTAPKRPLSLLPAAYRAWRKESNMQHHHNIWASEGTFGRWQYRYDWRYGLVGLVLGLPSSCLPSAAIGPRSAGRSGPSWPAAAASSGRARAPVTPIATATATSPHKEEAGRLTTRPPTHQCATAGPASSVWGSRTGLCRAGRQLAGQPPATRTQLRRNLRAGEPVRGKHLNDRRRQWVDASRSR